MKMDLEEMGIILIVSTVYSGKKWLSEIIAS